ncbi:hypothetical protein GS982_01515 [Rhodococcus hoagii]|uniref:Uncharacterized protein n=1 Tax=Rhodococcus hoagii TaxID=43767 RepID=A0A9Q5EX65_RHOHA|nr:hypothetical protein [Prescottella equi]NKT77275.1 hypothetical protein [Prescottella equi]NKT77999.1 hypothetical protein [Prescottella equi]NKZ81062.1 hypothetical protein [Prescottella equi]
MNNTARQKLSELNAEINRLQGEVDKVVADAVIERVREVAPGATQLTLGINGPNEWFIDSFIGPVGDMPTEEALPDAAFEDDELILLISNLRSKHLVHDGKDFDYSLDIPAL